MVPPTYRDSTKMRNALKYDWRLWTLSELRELLLAAGSSAVDVYTEGWDDETDDMVGTFRKAQVVRQPERLGRLCDRVGLIALRSSP